MTINLETATEAEIQAFENLHGCKLRRLPREPVNVPLPAHSDKELVRRYQEKYVKTNGQLQADVQILQRQNQVLIDSVDRLEIEVGRLETENAELTRTIHAMSDQSPQPSTSTPSESVSE